MAHDCLSAAHTSTEASSLPGGRKRWHEVVWIANGKGAKRRDTQETLRAVTAGDC